MDREMNNLYLYDQNEYGDYGDIPPEFRPDERNMFTLKHSLVIKYFFYTVSCQNTACYSDQNCMNFRSKNLS